MALMPAAFAQVSTDPKATSPLKRNKNGSIDIYLQHDSPGKNHDPNWLPAPLGGFNITLRMYWPKSEDPSILDGTWKPPGIIRQP